MSREDAFPDLLNKKRLYGIGVEVGVWRGDFSDAVLRRWSRGILVMVDPWEKQPKKDYPDPTIEGANWEEILAAARLVHVRHMPRVHIMRMKSLEAAEMYTASEVDWVYLDAVHTFEAVTADLRAWAPKVRAGGVLAGHDYIVGARADIEVVEAVNAFFGGSQRVHVIEDRYPSWYVEV